PGLALVHVPHLSAKQVMPVLGFALAAAILACAETDSARSAVDVDIRASRIHLDTPHLEFDRQTEALLGPGRHGFGASRTAAGDSAHPLRIVVAPDSHVISDWTVGVGFRTLGVADPVGRRFRRIGYAVSPGGRNRVAEVRGIGIVARGRVTKR